MHQRTNLGSLQTKVVQTGKRVRYIHPRSHRFQDAGPIQEDGTEIKIVPKRTRLTVDHGSRRTNVARNVKVVGIRHGRVHILGQGDHPLQGILSETQRREFGIDQRKFRLGNRCHRFHSFRTI